jgi:hypothetical protein
VEILKDNNHQALLEVFEPLLPNVSILLHLKVCAVNNAFASSEVL